MTRRTVVCRLSGCTEPPLAAELPAASDAPKQIAPDLELCTEHAAEVRRRRAEIASTAEGHRGHFA